MSGFDDPNYFAKAFRRAFAASPSEYRQTGVGAPAAAGEGNPKVK
jgi:AraC-like DNA-binding protein